MPTNVLTPVETEVDPFAAASDPDVIVPNYDLFGKIDISASAVGFVKAVKDGAGNVIEKGRKEPFNPTVHEKRFTDVSVYIQPLPEIDIKFPKTCEENWIAEFKPWAAITLPSIKAAGFANVREINGKWARIARVPNGKKYINGQGETKDETTFKFVEFFADEDACRAAYIANGGKSADHANAVPEADPSEAERQTAIAFLKVIVPTACNGKTTADEKKAAVTLALANYPTVSKFFTADSPEVAELIGA